jgi:hypothetical protein
MNLLRVYPLNQKAANSNARWSGANGAEKAKGEDGNLYVVKSPRYGRNHHLLTSSEVNETIAKEVVASHILADEFKLPGIPYQEGISQREDSPPEKAVICPYVPDLSTLWETSAKKIKNPDEAVAQSVVRGWLGDPDTIINNSNIFIKKDGTVLSGDYGLAFQRGIRYKIAPHLPGKGAPKASLAIMNEYASPSNVEPVSEKIKHLSDEEIRGMVHKYGTEYTSFWDSKLEDQFTQILIQNRDELAAKNVFENFYKGFHPFITPPISIAIGAVVPHIGLPLAQAFRVFHDHLPKGLRK